MASIVKKGHLDVKRKSKLGPAYRTKFVVLRRNLLEDTKLVEIYENDGLDAGKEQIQLSGMWSVQDRESQSKKRFAFELVIGANAVASFSCPSLLERDEWTESFRILNFISSSSPVPPIEDMYHVILEHNMFSSEIGISGPCLLRVHDGSVVLYSENGLHKLHQWSFNIIDNISMASDQVILDVHRLGGFYSSMRFTFNTDFNSSRNILIACSMMLESKNKKNTSSVSLNNIGLSLSSADTTLTKTQSLSRSFLGSVNKQSSKAYAVKEEKGVRRAKSFTDKSSFSIIRRSISPDSSRNVGSIHSIGSQESYVINRSSSQSRNEDTSPPPIPPRAPRRPQSIGFETINLTDPDYHYIKDMDVVDGGQTVNTQGDDETAAVDQQLDDLLRDIVEDNKIKQKKQMDIISPYAKTTKKTTLSHQSFSKVMKDIESKKLSYFEIYGDKGASDYLDPVPSKNFTSSPSHECVNPNSIISKRHSSGEFINTFHLSEDLPPGAALYKRNSSSHDYHTIPDTCKTVPSHGHSSSMDSTHTESVSITSDRRSWLRTHSGSDEPQSPPLPPRPSYMTQLPFKNMTPISKPPTQATVPPPSFIKGVISPYAITKGVIGVTPANTSPAPPLPPRSPSKHQRERVLSHSHGGSGCQKCNGVQVASKSLSSAVQYRLPKSPPSGTEKLQNDKSEMHVVHSQSKPRPKSQPMEGGENMSVMYGYGNEIDSALAMLDDCLTGLDVETPFSATESLDASVKSGNMIETDIDKAIKSIQELGTDLSQHSQYRSSQNVFDVMNTPSISPSSRVPLTQGGSIISAPNSKLHDNLSQNYVNSDVSNGNPQNGTAQMISHLPLSKFHSTNEIPSNTVHAHNVHYN